ncbi:MAG: hypothetical protein IJP14_04635 [Clostridia bacterium]|nr:hypothetical protein [Clostridia bacterium]
MVSCPFFGHRDLHTDISGLLRQVLLNLIENNGVEVFYVGNQGNFDYITQKMLSELADQYPIRYYIVLAYMPTTQIKNALLPDGIENVPKRFAIDWRNRWMLKRCEIVVTYVRHVGGGAAKFKQIAEKQHKTVINLAEL